MTLPLFYRSVVPLNRDTHRDLRLDAAPNYAFAAASHLVPAVLDEFAPACASLPILFAPDVDGPSPVFLTGLHPGRNRFVGAEGGWSGPYVPAYLRRYPFIMGEVQGAEPLLCIDERADGVHAGEAQGNGVAAVAEGGHVRLFTAEGADTEMLTGRLRLVNDYAAAARRTQAFGRLLAELRLLQPITVQSTGAETQSAVHGLLVVNELALNALGDEDYLRLRAAGAVAATYTHLVSLRAIERLPS